MDIQIVTGFPEFTLKARRMIQEKTVAMAIQNHNDPITFGLNEDDRIYEFNNDTSLRAQRLVLYFLETKETPVRSILAKCQNDESVSEDNQLAIKNTPYLHYEDKYVLFRQLVCSGIYYFDSRHANVAMVFTGFNSDYIKTQVLE